MEGTLLRVSRILLAALAAATLAGQVLEVERASDAPAVAMAIREARVIAVESGGPAALAGLEPGDLILGVGKQRVGWAYDALTLLKRLPFGVSQTLTVLRENRILHLAYTPRAPGELDLLWRIALAGVASLTLLIGVLVFLRKPRPVALLFASVCCALGFLIHPPFVPLQTGLLLAKTILLAAATLMLPALLVHLFLLFPLRHPLLERHPHAILVAYAPGLALLGLHLAAAGTLPTRSLADHWAPVIVRAGATLLWVAGIGTAIALFVHAYRHAQTGPQRRKVRVILWGTILGSAPVALLLVSRLIWPERTLPGDRFAMLAVILIPLSFGYAILRHGIFDPSLIVRRSLAYSLLVALLGIAYFGLQLLFPALWPELAQENPLWVSLLSLLAIAFLSWPAHRGLRTLIESRDTGALHSREDLLYEFGCSLRGLLDRDRLVQLISDSLAQALGARQVAYLETASDGALEMVYAYGTTPEHVDRHRFSPGLSDQLARLRQPVDGGDLDTELPYGYLSPDDQEILERLNAELLVPLRSASGLNGLVLVGAESFGRYYSADDLRLAEMLASEGGMALENLVLQERVLEEERLQQEVDVARDLQERLLPKSLPHVESLEISASSVPCHGVGGDYYDCFLTPEGDLLLAIGDASGKGVPGAILMANLQGLVRVEGMRSDPPWEIVASINRRLCAMRKPERFVTFCLARVRPRDGALAYCDAGHPGMLLARTTGEIEELGVGGLPLGIAPHAAYEGGRTQLTSGDVLLLYTDGITERQRGGGGDGEFFGDERLQALLRSGRRLSARALQESILGEVREFSPRPLDDDTTLLVIKFL